MAEQAKKHGMQMLKSGDKEQPGGHDKMSETYFNRRRNGRIRFENKKRGI